MNRFLKPSWLRSFLRFSQNSSALCRDFRQFSHFSVHLEPESWKSTDGLLLCPANYSPLSPISFLERAAKVYSDRTSVIYGGSKYTWRQTHKRCLKLASSLSHIGVSSADVVATLAPNVPAMYELHFAVPMAGAVLCPLNARLDSATVSVLLRHSEAKVLFVDHQLLDIARGALALVEKTEKKAPVLVLISESNSSSQSTDLAPNTCEYEYESLLEAGQVGFEVRKPKSELDPISLNYTSGTTSGPKGVVYSHRGAYLNAIATVFLHNMGAMPVYLWTVPMFHCNGWCLPWGVAAQGGTNVCLRKVSPKDIFESLALHKVTHMGGAPTVLNMIVNSRISDQIPIPHKVEVTTGGSPPPPQILQRMEDLGFNVTHLYGLTETYGPGAYCTWKPEWDSLPPDERYKIKARQGLQHLGQEDMDVRDPETMESVLADGKTMGEVMFRGNTVMIGYLKDLKATEVAFRGGWFRTGDLAVKHPNGYIEIKDRLKDIIISGGENISTVDVETVLYGHPAVLEVAVVAQPDEHWGQTPCAFVKLKEGFDVDARELIEFCRDHMPHYMAPKTIVFEDLPRTATGKVQKFVLRERAKALGSLS